MKTSQLIAILLALVLFLCSCQSANQSFDVNGNQNLNDEGAPAVQTTQTQPASSVSLGTQPSTTHMQSAVDVTEPLDGSEENEFYYQWEGHYFPGATQDSPILERYRLTIVRTSEEAKNCQYNLDTNHYNSDFFASNTLIILECAEGSCPVTHNIIDVIKNEEDLYLIKAERVSEECLTDFPCYTVIHIELNVKITDDAEIDVEIVTRIVENMPES